MPQGTFFWKKVEPFIGRDDVLEQLEKLLQDSKFHLVPISGEYGYGKTRLLKEILRLAKKQFKTLALPHDIIDLYQTENHTLEGLAQALVSNFVDYASYFEEYEHQKSKREEGQVAGDSLGAENATQAMLDACATGINRLSDEHGLLILLDTAEQWVYPLIEGSPFTKNAAPAWEWLQRVCSTLPRGMVILAGRPEIAQLGFEASKIIALPAFSEIETRKYVLQTVRQFKKEYNTAPIKLSDAEIQILCRLSQGRPILLALFLERILYGDERVRHAATESSPQDFESLLIKHIMEDPEIGTILCFIGRAPKGVDLELLAAMSGLPESELHDDLESLKGMSFAKTFSGNKRLFLHDEMYAMLERNIYEKEGDNTESDQAAKGIYIYYKTHTEQLNETIGQLYVEYAEASNADEKKQLGVQIDAATQDLQTLNTDFAYYRWLHAAKRGEDPVEMGLRRYYRLAHEAANSSDSDSLVLLRCELIRFIKKMEMAEKRKHQSWLPFLRGFLFIQEVWERNAASQSRAIAQDIETRMLPALEELTGLKEEQKTLLASLLKVWLGMSLLYGHTADYPVAERIFGESINSLNSIPESPSLTWLRNAVLSLAYRQRAYLFKRQGHFDDAIEDFQSAARANRNQDYNYEEATIRNDLGDTQVLTGTLNDASLNLKDAFDLRQKMKNGSRLALSYSTIARYFTARGAFAEAREYATRGVNLSSRVGRGTAFARIAWGEATRRYALESSFSLARRKVLFEKAKEAIIEALDGLNEPALIIDAKLELGCIYRDWLRIQTLPTQDQSYFDQANHLLCEVADDAASQNPPILHKVADAMSNRIWLGLFAQNESFALQASKDFEALDIFGFDITPRGVFYKEAKKMAESDKKPILQFIGKYHTALGTLVLGKEGIPDRAKMDKIALHWLLALEYSALFAHSYRGLDSAFQTIHKRIKKFNQEELAWLTKSVLDAEKDEGITDSLLRRFMGKNSFWVEA